MGAFNAVRSKHHTGSAYLDELIARRDQIWKRLNTRPVPQPQPGLELEPKHAPAFPPLPQQNIKSVEERVEEARNLNLPILLTKYIIECIRESADYFGDFSEQTRAQPFDYQPEVQSDKPTIARIQAVTARYFNLCVADIVCVRHYARMARPRHIAIFLSKELTNNTMAEIGRRFNRDHTTVLHSIQRIIKLIETDKTLADDIAILRGMLNHE